MPRSKLCSDSSVSRRSYTALRIACSLVLLFSSTLGADTEHTVVAEVRLSERSHSALWQHAIVKLAIPVSRVTKGRRRHFTEDCTGTLLKSAKVGAAYVLTAWHCFDGHDDLTKPAKVRWQGQWYESRLLATGGSMSADWAVVVISGAAISSDLGLTVSPREWQVGQPVVMAGFSGDEGLGEGGDVLTWDPACEITEQRRHWTSSSCQAYRGASGGPVITSDSDGNPTVIGVVSARDEDGSTLLITSHRFYHALQSAMN